MGLIARLFYVVLSTVVLLSESPHRGRVPAQDVDSDLLPDGLEPSLLPNFPYNPANPTTYLDTFGYHAPPPNQPLRDVEHFALKRQAPWTSGSANNDDWANPGMQHATIGDSDD